MRFSAPWEFSECSETIPFYHSWTLRSYQSYQALSYQTLIWWVWSVVIVIKFLEVITIPLVNNLNMSWLVIH